MRLWNRVRFWLQRPRLNNDLAEEIRLHREMLEEQLIRGGTPPGEARFAAARRFGNLTAAVEQSNDEWSFRWLDAALKDLRFAWRLTLRQPLVTIAAVLTVAFGVGANTAIVSVLETVLLNPLGMRQAGKVVTARVRMDKIQMRHAETSGVEFREIAAMTDTFSAVAAIEGRYWISQVGGEATRLIGRAVTPDFFRVFGEYPAIGRFFAPEDRESVVLSHGLWTSAFGGDPSALGRVMILDDKPYRIVGVAPAAFRFPATAQLWTPLILTPDRLQRRGYNMMLSVFARLRDGVTLAQAEDRVARHVAALKSAGDAEGREISEYGYGIEIDPFARYIAGDLRRPLWLLWAAALVVLVTGCANVAGLLLTRASGRGQEIAIRLAVGATRAQIVRQLLIESLLLGALGGAAGLLMAHSAVSLLTRLAIPGKQLLALVSLDWRLLLYGFALALLSGLLFGLAPAIQLFRESQSPGLVRSRRHSFQHLFVTAEVAGAFVLVILTGLLVRSLWAVQRIQPGFDPRQVSTAFFLKPKNDPGFLDRLQAALDSSPGLTSAALALPVPFSGGGFTSGFRIRNRQQTPGEPEWHGEAYMVTPRYFETLRIPLLLGRNLSDSDAANAPLVCLIDARFADRFFPNQDPIGQEIAMYGGWARIVGVTGTIRGTTLEEGSRPVAYYSLAQVASFPHAAIVARSDAPAAGAIREAVRRTNASVPIFDVTSMEERIGESLGVRRVMAELVSVFGAIGLLLATIGLYGVIAQLVAERTREIGIRAALGARPGQILSHFLRQGLRSGILGLIVGFAAAAYAQRWLASLLYEVKPFDAATFSAASLGVLSLLSLAVWWPARRAARIDPGSALRHE
ncbi:MAG: ABC transporter permease [Bryobacterales bacterium]|nr:ABC transporter permease [Bryobacterales bacterium]